MRVCFVSFEYTSNIIGGAGVYAETVVRGLRSKGVDVFVITKGDRNSCDSRTFGIPASNAVYWRRLFFIMPAADLLRKLNKRLGFDLVHINEPHLPMLGLPDLPTVCTVHSNQASECKTMLANLTGVRTTRQIEDLVFKNSVGSISEVLACRGAHRIICPSYQLARLVESYCFVDQRRIAVIPNGIDIRSYDEIQDSDVGILDRYGLEGENYLLFVGRLSFYKGVQYLIKAFKAIKEEFPKPKLVIVGKGDFERNLRNLVCTYGAKDVVFTGYVDSLKDKKALYKNSLMVVVPSLYDTLPMVVLEAMACGKAVIGSTVGDIPMLIRDGKNGLLTHPGDTKSLQRAMRILYDDENLRKSMGLFGRELLEKEFTSDKMAERTLKLYNSLC
jgi:glycogen(starch) synthase